MSPERALDAATDLLATQIGHERAIAVVERALIDEAVSDLGRESLDRVLDRLRARAIPQKESVEA